MLHIRLKRNIDHMKKGTVLAVPKWADGGAIALFPKSRTLIYVRESEYAIVEDAGRAACRDCLREPCQCKQDYDDLS